MEAASRSENELNRDWRNNVSNEPSHFDRIKDMEDREAKRGFYEE